MTTTPIDDERLDRILAGLDPARQFAAPALREPLEQLASLLENANTRQQLTRELARPTSRTKTRRIGWGIFGLLVIVFGAWGAVPAASAIEQWLAHTHTFGANFSPTKLGATTNTESDSSEWIGLNASGINQALAGLYPSYLKFPAGITKDDAIRTIIRLNKASVASDDAGEAHVIAQATLIHETYEAFSTCAWYGDWLTADTSHDTARLAIDNAGIEAAVYYPATLHQSPTIIPYQKKWADEAAAGDRAAIEKGYSANACSGFMEGLTP